MAEDLISSIIDNPAIEAEIKKVEARLDALATTIKTFPKAQVFYDSTGLKDLSAANKELSVVMKDLRVKNLELTNSIKEQQLVEKQLSVQRKQAIADAKAKSDAEKESAKQAQIASAEKIKALAAQKKAEQDLEEVQKQRAQTQSDLGTFDIAQGSGQAGGAKLKTPVVKEAAFVPANDTEASLLFLTQTQTALKGNLAVQKDLDAQLKAGTISQAKYDEQIVAAKLAESEYRKQIQLTNAELKARTNADFAVQGTIDAAKAQNTILTQQRNAIPVGEGATAEDLERLKAINAEIDKNNDLIDKNSDLLAKQKINIGNYPTNAFSQTFKTLNTELDQVHGKLVSGNFKGAELDQLTAKFNVLTNATALTGKSFSTTGAQSKAFTEAGIQIGQVYGKNSDFFKQFVQGVKDGQVNIKGFASEISGVATKGKGFMGFLSGAYNGIRKLAYAIPGVGIGGLILLLLGPLQAAGAAIFRSLTKTEEEVTGLTKEAIKQMKDFQKATSDVNQEYIKTSTGSIMKLELLRNIITDTTKTEKQRLAALNDYNKIADANNKLDAKQLDNLNLINDTISKQIYLVGQRALAAANEKILEDKAVKLSLAEEKARAKAEELIDATTIQTVQKAKTNAYFITLEREGAIRREIAKDAAVKQAQDEFDAQKKVNAEFLLKNGFVGGPPPKTTTGGQKNAENLLDEFRKKTLKEQQEYLKELNQRELNGYKAMANDQQASLLDRLDAEKKFYEKSLEMAKQNVKDQTDAVDLESDIADKKAAKIKDPKKRADTLIQIEKYRTEAIKKINEEGNSATLKINEDYYTQNVAIAEQAYEKLKKEAEDAAKFIEGQQKIAFQNKKDTVDIEKDDQLLQLDKDFQDGKIKNLEEYNAKKEAIETAADIKQKALDLKRIQDAEKFIEAFYGVKNLNLIKQAKDLELEIEQEGNKKILESQKELNEKKKQFAQDLADFIESGLLAVNQKQEDQLDKESQDVDKKTQKEVDAINASGLAEEEKQKRITKAQKQAAFDQEQIAKQKDKLDKQRKTIQRLADVAEVGAEIAKEVFALAAKAAAARAEAFLLLANPVTSWAAPMAFAAAGAITAQVPFVLASGGLALVKAAAFEKGTDNAPKGPAIVGEKGSELIVTKEGQMYVTPPRPTLIELAGGEKVFRHDITADFLKHYNLLNILQKAQAQKQPVSIENGFNKKAIELLTKIERKSPHITMVTERMETSDYYLRNIKR
jgi:hypothetical protein